MITTALGMESGSWNHYKANGNFYTYIFISKVNSKLFFMIKIRPTSAGFHYIKFICT